MNIWLNTGVTDSPLGVGEFTLMDSDIDYLILLTNGSTSVADGQPIPSTTQLNNAGVFLTGVEQICSKYFLADVGSNILKLIHNMGAANKRYVFAFDFTEATGTTSEPILEAWDDVTMDTVNSVCLGAGTPSSSWISGITTTNGLPGVGWVGSRLAGDTSGHYLELNGGNGPLSAAKTLYAQLKVTIPSTETSGGNEQPILVVKYTTV
jgi:hypothetical protein